MTPSVVRGEPGGELEFFDIRRKCQLGDSADRGIVPSDGSAN
jgi:hypothetical protein